MPPDFARFEFAIGVKACEFGACSRAAWGTVIGFPGAENEILAVDAGNLRWAEKFDVINFFSVRAFDSLSLECLTNGPCKLRKFVDIADREIKRVIVDQEKPVAAPGNISRTVP